MSKKHTIHEFSIQEAQNIQLGQSGYTHLKISTGLPISTEEGHFIALTSLNDNTRMYLTGAEWGHDPDGSEDPYHTINVPAGMTVYGSWNKVSVYRSGSGTAEAIIYHG